MHNVTSIRFGLLWALAGCAPVAAIIGGTGGNDASCESTPVLGPDGQATGFVRCDDGVVLRDQRRTGVQPIILGDTCSLDDQPCSADTDCTGGFHGRCLQHAVEWDPQDRCACSYSCTTDDECGEGQICLPPGVWPQGPAWGTCIAASCGTNDDCESDECGFTAFDDGCGWEVQLVCRSKADSCRTHSDCSQTGGACEVGYQGDYQCRTPDCDIGRPLTTASGWRKAPVTPRSDWITRQRVPELSAADRHTLHAHWSRIGALEHASVASFARHTLELMSLGAPRDLLTEVQRAAADEVVHATLTFGLASAYGHDVGPGRLDLDGVRPRTTPEQIFRALVIEGCIGETLGTAEAGLAAKHAVGDVRDVLLQIAEDEARHAALAMNTARWMLLTWPHLNAVLDEVLDEQRVRPAPPAGPPHRLAAHGMLTQAQRAHVHAQVLGDRPPRITPSQAERPS